MDSDTLVDSDSIRLVSRGAILFDSYTVYVQTYSSASNIASAPSGWRNWIVYGFRT